MISGIVLAAGRSSRMGQPKMLLPWGQTTVLGQVIESVRQAGIYDILVITGGARESVENIAAQLDARTAYNEGYETSEMLSSIRLGLENQISQAQAALICLGDQPQIQPRNVRSICDAFIKDKFNLVVPSYKLRRGHPWLVARPLWDELIQLQPPKSPRDFLNAHAQEIKYVAVDDPSIIEDLDTPEDYLKSKP